MDILCVTILRMSRKDFIDKLVQIFITALLAAIIAFFQALIATFSTMQVPLQSPEEVAVLGGALRFLQLYSVSSFS